MRKIGAVASGEAPTSAELADGLTELNSMLSLWRVKRLVIPLALSRETYSLVSGTQDYTIGSGGTWNRSLVPWRIDKAGILMGTASPDTELPVAVYTEEEWAALSVKGLTSAQVTAIRYVRGASLGTVSIWPIITSSTPDLVLYIPTPLASPSTLATSLVLLDGYEDAYVYNLALRLMPEYGSTVSPQAELRLERLASDALSTIKGSNVAMVERTIDPALLVTGVSTYDINADT